jgi:Ras-related protein Rab-5C
MYYRNAQSALVVYDLTKPASLIKAKHWVAELQRQALPGIVIALVGNKLDLCDGEDRKITTEEGLSYAEEEGLLFFETSAKTGSNVSEVFEGIASGIPESTLKGPKPKATEAESRVNLTGPRGEAANEGCAC